MYQKLKPFIWFAAGLTTGVIICCIKPSSGTLRIDRSDPEKDIYRLDIDDDLSKLHTKRRITLNVDSDADLSQN